MVQISIQITKEHHMSAATDVSLSSMNCIKTIILYTTYYRTKINIGEKSNEIKDRSMLFNMNHTQASIQNLTKED